MLINCANIYSYEWPREQYDEAIKLYEEIVDIHLPNISSNAEERDILKIAHDCVDKIRFVIHGRNKVVFLQGYPILTFTIARLIQMHFPDIKIIDAIFTIEETVTTCNNIKEWISKNIKFNKFIEYPDMT